MKNSLDSLYSRSLVLDTETTSLDFKEAEVIEYAADDVMNILTKVSEERYTDVVSNLFKPSTPIQPEVSAVTHITNRMVEGQKSFEDGLHLIQSELDSFDHMIAHNAFYDVNVLQRYRLELPAQICTMRMARKLYANDVNVTQFNLPYLRYALDLPIPDDFVAHRASVDVILTGLLFTFLVDKAIEDRHIDGNANDLGAELIAWLNEPVITTIMPFGKHKGQKMEDIPLGYWQWALENVSSLQEDAPEYDKDFAASVSIAVEKAFEKQN